MYTVLICLEEDQRKTLCSALKEYAKSKEVDIKCESIEQIPEKISFNKYTALICSPQNINYSVFTPIAFYCDKIEDCIPYMFSRPCGIIRVDNMKSDMDLFFKRLINKQIVTCKNGRFLIPINEIIYIESEAHYINIYTTYEKIRERKKISEFIEENKTGWLIRVSQSYIVNLMHVKKIKYGMLEMTNHKQVRYSTNYVTEEIVQIIMNKRG